MILLNFTIKGKHEVKRASKREKKGFSLLFFIQVAETLPPASFSESSRSGGGGGTLVPSIFHRVFCPGNPDIPTQMTSTPQVRKKPRHPTAHGRPHPHPGVYSTQ